MTTGIGASVVLTVIFLEQAELRVKSGNGQSFTPHSHGPPGMPRPLAAATSIREAHTA